MMNVKPGVVYSEMNPAKFCPICGRLNENNSNVCVRCNANLVRLPMKQLTQQQYESIKYGELSDVHIVMIAFLCVLWLGTISERISYFYEGSNDYIFGNVKEETIVCSDKSTLKKMERIVKYNDYEFTTMWNFIPKKKGRYFCHT